MIRIVPDKEGRLTQWDKDRKVIVTGFEGGAEVHFASPGDDHGAYVVELTGDEAAVPNILLTMAGVINVYVYPADRTVFAAAFPVMAREKPDDYIYTETEVLSYKTLNEKIGDLAKLTTAAKENLVAAINEAATKGTASVYMRVAEGYIEYSGDGVKWEKLIAVDELKGEKGDKGDTGAQGQQGEKGEKGDKGDPGKDAAADISLGITSAAVGDIVKVKAVDENGKPTQWMSVGSHLVFEETTAEEVNMITYSPPTGYWITDYVVEVTTPKWESGTANKPYYIRPYNSYGGLQVKTGLRPSQQFASKTFLSVPCVGNDYTYLVCTTQGSDIYYCALSGHRYTQYMQVYTLDEGVLFPVGTNVKIYARIVTEAEKNANL